MSLEIKKIKYEMYGNNFDFALAKSPLLLISEPFFFICRVFHPRIPYQLFSGLDEMSKFLTGGTLCHINSHH